MLFTHCALPHCRMTSFMNIPLTFNVQSEKSNLKRCVLKFSTDPVWWKKVKILQINIFYKHACRTIWSQMLTRWGRIELSPEPEVQSSGNQQKPSTKKKVLRNLRKKSLNIFKKRNFQQKALVWTLALYTRECFSLKLKRKISGFEKKMSANERNKWRKKPPKCNEWPS